MRHYDTGPYKPYEPPPAARCMWATDQRNPYITNINHPIIRAEYAEYCRARGLRQDIPMSDDERLAFDVAMVQKIRGGSHHAGAVPVSILCGRGKICKKRDCPNPTKLDSLDRKNQSTTAGVMPVPKV